MAFSIPQMPLDVDIYSGPYSTRVFRATEVCNLAQGRRGYPEFGYVNWDNPISYGMPAQLLLPALTDIRDTSVGGPRDVVEVPAGSGRWYMVMTVDDVGKGFANEFRVALLLKIYEALSPEFAGLNWPTPIP